MKYISFQRKSKGFQEMVIFPETIHHSDMAKGLGQIDLIGAGFISLSVEKDSENDNIVKVSCFGKSTSLDISSHEDDSALAQILFGRES